MAQWHTLQSARAEWIDAPEPAVDANDLDGDAILSSLLNVAKDAVLAYAPAVDGVSTPAGPDVISDTGVTATLTRINGVVTAVIEADGDASAVLTIPDAYLAVNETSAQDDIAAIAMGDSLTVENISASPATLTMVWLTDEDVDTIPDSYRAAQLMQARNVWNASRVSPSAGDFDSGQYGLVTYPLDWQIRQLLRPKHGLPVIA